MVIAVPRVGYAARASLQVAAQDLDDYLAGLKDALTAAIRVGKRVQA